MSSESRGRRLEKQPPTRRSLNNFPVSERLGIVREVQKDGVQIHKESKDNPQRSNLEGPDVLVPVVLGVEPSLLREPKSTVGRCSEVEDLDIPFGAIGRIPGASGRVPAGTQVLLIPS